MREYEFLLFDGPVQKSEALMAAHAESSLSQASTIGEWISMLSEYLTANFSYVPAITTYDSTVEDVLAKRAGVCQDFAHLSIGLARLSGLPARYVNGYLHQDNMESGPSQSHAWFELWSPTCGWVPYDSTHHQDTGERHVVVAYGRNYDDAPPNRGIFAGNAFETLEAEVFTRALEPEVHRAPIMRSDTLDLPLYRSAPDGVVESIEHPRHGSTEDQQQQQQQ
jgi:transglutaminase-like putative cysteine protease